MRIGLEVHVALPTKSKLFCSCSADAQEPNTAICPICLGFPGSKPMLNEEALHSSLNIANALHCKINKNTYFLRKVYFYPDLPKSYQITQLDGCVGLGGYVQLEKKKVRIRRVQIEEDPAKIIREDDYCLLDFNRSGIPLNEIVTEPDIESEEELREFVNELRSILYYAGVDIDKEMKADLNISLGTERVEIKNVTGIKNLIDATRYESKRQSELLSHNQNIKKETRSYSAESMSTVSSREKETDEEYGFIYEPDLAVYNTDGIGVLKPQIVSDIAKGYAEKYAASKETLKELVMFDKESLRLLEYGVERSKIGTVISAISLLKRTGSTSMSNDNFGKMLEYMNKGMLLNEDTIKALEQNRKVEVEKGAVSSEEIDKAIKELISQRPDLVKEYKTNPKAFNFIVGIILKRYKVSPKYVSERLAEALR
ncbi:MAG: Asp-tRNA(Asn)/Glu-tRNA(Gln) amidotransferase subunit GatB [Candidatus Micrarchaeota archaeon]|nr:Asp-tRNA(Asn)/Glu-tRNA(Gln) amidotransferase subunit GatB [Candidatus Micrarchaeota archaeon]MDE1833784.1 Asp-tRNA(Asn)/Glu-tRNA(Gln) amidotransferase subunit GatB [Candidatus Micrarchaeota archaeon]MDE1859150.1 Asp-tRNA(Asn)/Glu-tRNA(Gln) amidotransferase subunit GatB [Candidatus Micrarchaeota archaeon]